MHQSMFLISFFWTCVIIATSKQHFLFLKIRDIKQKDSYFLFKTTFAELISNECLTFLPLNVILLKSTNQFIKDQGRSLLLEISPFTNHQILRVCLKLMLAPMSHY